MIIRPEEEFIVTFQVKVTVSICISAPEHDLAIERAQLAIENMNSKESVSYTHLTLPTKRIV